MDLAVEVTGLRKSFGDHAVLRGVDLAVPRGTVHGLLGPNGAGKTTLVRVLATLLPADGGVALVDGVDVARQARQVRGRIGLTGQYASVDALLTGRENLVMVGRLLHLGTATARRRADEVLARFDLADAADRRVATYSGGMRRRLDLAASLLAAPPVVFLDEPTTGLDPRSRRTLWDAVRELARAGTTILLTTQYLEEADALADEISVLHDGCVVTAGTAAALKQQVGRERVTVAVDPAHLSTAALLLVADDPVVDTAAATLNVAVDGPARLRGLLNALADAGVTVTRVRLSSPTLDDVFFAVTATTGTEVVA